MVDIIKAKKAELELEVAELKAQIVKKEAKLEVYEEVLAEVKPVENTENTESACNCEEPICENNSVL